MKHLIRYTLAWISGIVVVILAVPVLRFTVVRNEVAAANALLLSGSPAESWVRAQRILAWASLYPPMARELAVIAIRCQVRLGNLPAAEAAARAILDGVGLRPRQPIHSWEAIQRPVDAWLASRGSAAASLEAPAAKWAGYLAVAGELERRKDLDDLVRLGESLASLDPANPVSPVAHRVVKALTPPTPAAPLPPDTPPPALVAPPSAREPDYLDLARRHIARKEWDKALEACEKALQLTPDDPRGLEMKERALTRDMRWACVRTASAKVYDLSGKAILSLPAGAVVEVTGFRNSPSSGQLAVCLVSGSQDAHVPVFIRAPSLDITPGLLSRVSEEEKSLRIRRAKLLAEMERVRLDAKRDSAADNPHRQEYEQAMTAYRQYWDKVNALTRQRDEAEGEARMKASDELRMMKGDDIRIGQALESAKKKMASWDQPRDVPSSDPRLAPLEAEMATLQTELARLRAQP